MTRSLCALAALLAALSWATTAQGTERPRTCAKLKAPATVPAGDYWCIPEALKKLATDKSEYRRRWEAEKAVLGLCKRTHAADVQVWKVKVEGLERDLSAQVKATEREATRRDVLWQKLETAKRWGPWVAVGIFVAGGLTVRAVGR